jgi:DNA polymerase-3 subunit gamma/tau
MVQTRDAHGGLHYLAELIMQGYDLQEFLVELLEHLRNLYLGKSSVNVALIEATEVTRQRYVSQAAAFTEEDLLRMMHIVSEGQLRLREAAQPRLFFELTILKLLQLPRVDALRTLIAEVEAMKATLAGNVLPEASKQEPAAARNAPPKPEKKPEAVLMTRESEPAFDQAKSPVSLAEPLRKPEAPPTFTIPTAIPAAPAPAAPKPARPPEPDIFSIFDAPAIRKAEATAPAPIHAMPGTGSISLDGSLALAAQPERTVSLSELLTRWDAFCENAEQKLGTSLCLVLRRSRPLDLADKRLTLLCEDEFYLSALEEHRMDIAGALKAFFHVAFTLVFKKAERVNDTPEVEDNYTRFQKLRQDDPRIRLLVDLFGAEPEF